MANSTPAIPFIDIDRFDPDADNSSSLEPPFAPSQLPLAPLVPEEVLRRHYAFIAGDTRFAASARLLAHLWRQDQNLPTGTHIETDTKGKTRRAPANWLLRRDAAQSGATFLTPAIRDFARQALLFREPGAMWNEGRLWGNLLSSQAATINLLAPLALDLVLATRVWRRLLPGFVYEVTGLRFEHSPGRYQEHYFGDGTAVDAIIEAVTPEGEVAIITIEVKFIEGLIGPSATPRPRYVEAAQESRLYKDPNSPTLARPGFEQLRREHVLTSLMLRHGLASRGRFVLIAPQLNRRAQAVAALYKTELADPAGQQDPSTVAFVNLTLEQVIAALAEANASAIAGQLWARYCDHARVARFALNGENPPPTSPTTSKMPALPAPTAAGAILRPRHKARASSGPGIPSKARSSRIRRPAQVAQLGAARRMA